MLIAGVLCVCLAVASAGFGAVSLSQSLSHRRATKSAGINAPSAVALRAMAPTQLAAAVMLAAGGVVAIAASGRSALVLLVVCVVGAVGTLAAGSWQSARFALRQQAPGTNYEADCAGNCAGCALSCR
jgi:hypothetical protein